LGKKTERHVREKQRDGKMNQDCVLLVIISLEGGAGERVQGARAAYGTCFIRADCPGPPLIPAFFRLPFQYFIRHT
jgi:hypothetical protein